MTFSMSPVFLLVAFVVAVAANSPPYFIREHDMNYFSISEATTPSEESPVYRLAARDPEGKGVSFSFYDATTNSETQRTEFFRVDAATGEVFLIKRLDVDGDGAGSDHILLPLSVSDGERSSNVLSTIEVTEANDEAPYFEGAADSESLQIPEDSAVNTHLLRIVVKDVDASNEGVEVRCKPLPDSPEACIKFDVRPSETDDNSWTGNLVLVGSLDFETTRAYGFILEATDGRNFAEMTVRTEILNIQDTPPVVKRLNVAIHEELPVGSAVGRLEAVDGDADPKPFHGLEFEIVDDPSRLFGITQAGVLKTTGRVDREALRDGVETLVLQVRVSEVSAGVVLRGPESVSYVEVTILVIDINDNAPVITPAFKEVTVKRSEILSGTNRPLVEDMVVIDTDAGANSEFEVQILDDGVDAAAFRVFPDQPQRSRANSRVYLYSHQLERDEVVLRVVAAETKSAEKQSTTATVVVRVVNDLEVTSSSSSSKPSSVETTTSSRGGVNDIVVTFAERSRSSADRPVSMIVVAMAIVCGVLLVVTVVTGVVLLRKKPVADDDDDDFEAGEARDSFRQTFVSSSSTLPHDTASTILSDLDPDDKEVYGIYKMSSQQQVTKNAKTINLEFGSPDQHLTSVFVARDPRDQHPIYQRQQMPDIYRSHRRAGSRSVTSDSSLLPASPPPVSSPAFPLPHRVMTDSEMDLVREFADNVFRSRTTSPARIRDGTASFSDSTSSETETVVAPIDVEFFRAKSAAIKHVVRDEKGVAVLRPEQLYEEIPRGAARVPDVIDSCCLDIEAENNNNNDSNVNNNTHVYRVQTGDISSFDAVAF